jgi:sec-independent protein translocase protein TatA
VLAEIFGVDGIVVIVCVVIVLLFGGAKLPKLARGLGSASHEFKKGLEEGDKEAGTDLPGTASTPQALPEKFPKDASTN